MYSSQSSTLDCAYPVIRETVPQSALGYHANNKYDGFPPLMSDGRSVTATWQPESTINADLLKSNNIQSNWEYRRYLTKHATHIMQYNFRESSNDVGYYKRPLDVLDIQSNLVLDTNRTPYVFNSVLDNTKPIGYSTSDLKDTYLTREQLNSRKISPVITQEQLLKMQ
jgi:hypothetical protein